MRDLAHQALILDFGGVISRTLFETHALSEAALGLPPGTLTWRGPFDPATDLLWQAMQADEITERDYWMARTREVGRLVGEDWQDMKTFVQRARGADVQEVIRPEAVKAIRQAKAAGCKLAILSNELDLFYGADFRQRLPLLGLFDVIVDATHTGILKPDPRAYSSCLAELNVTAAHAVFVDDQLRNIEGAQRCGIQVVHFDVHEPGTSFDSALQLLGVLS
jgi:putative hydrolase of the HAD superfamily